MASKKIQDRINSLLRRAEHPNTTPEEAQACQEKAEALMQKYRLEEAELHLTEEQKRVFEKKVYNRTTVDGWRFASEFGGLVVSVAEHTNCYFTYSTEDKGYVILGYPHDVFYADVLIQRAVQAYNELIYPTWNDTYSLERNIHRLKTSGSTWEEVLYSLPNETYKEVLAKYKWPLDFLERSFRKYEKQMGLEPATFTRRHQAYQDTLRKSFRRRLDDRLYDLKKKASQDEGLVSERDRLAVAIVKDEDALKQEFYRLFPNHSPEAQKKRREEMEKEMADRQSAFNALSEEEQKKVREEEAKKRAREKKEWREFQERNRPDPAAWSAGTEAADRVRLSLNDEIKDNRVFIEA